MSAAHYLTGAILIGSAGGFAGLAIRATVVPALPKIVAALMGRGGLGK